MTILVVFFCFEWHLVLEEDKSRVYLKGNEPDQVFKWLKKTETEKKWLKTTFEWLYFNSQLTYFIDLSHQQWNFNI